MQDIERYLDRVVNTEADASTGPRDLQRGKVGAGPALGGSAQDEPPKANSHALLTGLLRRWKLIMVVFVLVTIIAVPIIWLVVQPGYVVAGLLRLASRQEDPLTGNLEQVSSFGGLRTEAMSVIGPDVVERVADEFSKKNPRPEFFSQGHDIKSRIMRKLGVSKLTDESDPAVILRGAIRVGVIDAEPVTGTEFIRVRMKSMRPAEAKEIVDAIIDNYLDVQDSGGQRAMQNHLNYLEGEQKVLRGKMDKARIAIRQEAARFQTTALDAERELASRRATSLFEQLSALESRRVNLEIRIAVLKTLRGQVASSQAAVEGTDISFEEPSIFRDSQARVDYITKDPQVQQINGTIMGLRQELVVGGLTLKSDNPTLLEKKRLLEAFQEQYDQRREELGKEYDALILEREANQKKAELAVVEKELEHVKAYEDHLRTLLDGENTQARQIGAASLEIQDLTYQYTLDKEMFDQISRRIKQLEIEMRRSSWVTRYGKAELMNFEDNRMKLSLAATLGGLGLGLAIAFLLHRADKRIWDPEEVTQHVSAPLLGTITGVDLQQQSEFPDQLISDFQSIRTNLSLTTSGGLPPMLTVVSPARGDGKTAFCVNLATSLASTGKRVLLIDGDLRRPSIARVLNIAGKHSRSHKVTMDGGFEYAVYTIPTTGLDVLLPEARFLADPFELINSPVLSQRVRSLSEKYDHVIIDTPPILAFPDATIVACITASAIMVSFCGRTNGPDLAEAELRLTKAGIKVVGVVMNNVVVDKAYLKYGFGYENEHPRSNPRSGRVLNSLVLPAKEEDIAHKHDEAESVKEGEPV